MKRTSSTPTIDEALANLRKQYGDGVMLAQNDIPKEMPIMETNCFAIDRLLGCGGLPKSRIIEVFSEPSAGKTSLCLFFASQVQKAGGKVVYIDAENSYDAVYAKNIGVNTKDLMVSQSESLEEAFDIIRALSETKAIDLIIVDSVASLTPKSELEGEEMLKDTMALQARLLSRALRIVSGPIARSGATVIFINQTRSKVGVFWGNPEVTSGGKALKYYSSVRLNVSKGAKILGKKDEQIGHKIKVTAVKNKVGFPFKSGSIDFYYESGVDLIADVLDTAEELAVVTRSGSTYSFGDVKLGVGREKVINFLKEDASIVAKLRKAIIKIIKTK